jgi:hypothetical protein
MLTCCTGSVKRVPMALDDPSWSVRAGGRPVLAFDCETE